MSVVEFFFSNILNVLLKQHISNFYRLNNCYLVTFFSTRAIKMITHMQYTQKNLKVRNLILLTTIEHLYSIAFMYMLMKFIDNSWRKHKEIHI